MGPFDDRSNGRIQAALTSALTDETGHNDCVAVVFRHEERQYAAVTLPSKIAPESVMSKVYSIAATALLSVGCLGAMAQSPPADHTQHHPAGASSTTTSQTSTPTTAPAASDRMAAMEKQLQAMKAMREKLAAAKTPEERRAVMAEHMKTMHDSMTVVDMVRPATGSGGMGMMSAASASAGASAPPHAMSPGMHAGQGGTMPMMEAMHHRHQMMEKRMEMMESMMRMMMDRMQ